MKAIDLVQIALAEAIPLAESAEVVASCEKGFSVEVHQGEVESFHHNEGRSLSVTVYINHHQKGSATTTDFSLEAIKQSVHKAYTIAKYCAADLFNGLADADLMAKFLPDLRVFHEWAISPPEAIQLLIECESVAVKQDKRITQSENVSLSTHEIQQVYGNSHGFMGQERYMLHRLDCTLLAEQKDSKERDGEYSLALDPSKLMKPLDLATASVRKVVSRLGARRIKTQRCPVIFEAPIARSLIQHFLSVISGSRLYQRTSFLRDQLGKIIFPEFISIDQRPYLEEKLGSAAFDAEGVQTKELNFIKNGVLENYLLDSYAARKLQMKTTGNAGGAFNVFIEPISLTFKDLLKEMKRGLLVTEFLGQGVNLVTGDYSRGAFGYWVEQGEIQYPVHEITIAGNLKDMFQHIVAGANDIDHRSSI